ncbi:hypothetical protein TELCIR_10682, partial [Teladorsagia circumcincta]
MLFLPFFADQPRNALFARHLGIAEVIYKKLNQEFLDHVIDPLDFGSRWIDRLEKITDEHSMYYKNRGRLVSWISYLYIDFLAVALIAKTCEPPEDNIGGIRKAEEERTHSCAKTDNREEERELAQTNFVKESDAVKGGKPRISSEENAYARVLHHLPRPSKKESKEDVKNRKSGKGSSLKAGDAGKSTSKKKGSSKRNTKASNKTGNLKRHEQAIPVANTGTLSIISNRKKALDFVTSAFHNRTLSDNKERRWPLLAAGGQLR